MDARYKGTPQAVVTPASESDVILASEHKNTPRGDAHGVSGEAALLP